MVTSPDAVARYELRNLCPTGALLTGGALLEVGTPVEVLLQLGAGAPMRIEAEVVHHVAAADGTAGMGVSFFHDGDAAEDAIQSALLAELEEAAAAARA
jgi:hypothetical protein